MVKIVARQYPLKMPARPQRGASMIEILVTMVIIAFGLLGMAGLQSRLQVAELEAYQRAQAMVLLNDIAGRITTNRNATASDAYVTASEITSSTNCASTFSGTTMAQIDLKEWCLAVQGSAEVKGTTKTGGMIGSRGCIASLGNREYMVTVVWQGLAPISAPPSSVTCGANQYDSNTGTGCINDLCRRVLTTVVRIASLT